MLGDTVNICSVSRLLLTTFSPFDWIFPISLSSPINDILILKKGDLLDGPFYIFSPNFL